MSKLYVVFSGIKLILVAGRYNMRKSRGGQVTSIIATNV
jgi:hypothetical protein